MGNTKKWIFDLLITVLGASLLFMGSLYFRDKMVTKIELPVWEEIKNEESGNGLVRYPCKRIQAKMLLVSNGPFGEKAIWIRQVNDFDIKKVFIGRDNMTAELSDKMTISGKLDESEIVIDRLKMPPMEQIALMYYSDDTDKKSYDSKHAKVMIGDKQIDEAIIVSKTELYIFASIFVFLGVLLYRMFAHIKWFD